MKRRTFLATVLAPNLTAASEPGVAYSVGSWPEEFGNHRARLSVPRNADRVAALIPWRRHDDPSGKEIFVVHAATGRRIDDVEIFTATSASCDLAFRPLGPGEYYVYYMPYTAKRLPHAYRTVYRPAAQAPSGAPAVGLPWARLIDIQARSEFDRFDPMEVAATTAEMRRLADRFPAVPFLVFAEERQRAIRMTRYLPLRWIESGPVKTLRGEAQRDEFFVFQLGVWAPRQNLSEVKVRCAGPFAFRCINLSGTDWLGRAFQKRVQVAGGRVQAFWCGVEVPLDVRPGLYEMRVEVESNGHQEVVQIALRVDGRVIEDKGDSDLWRFTRLRWLDSTIGIADTPTAPYTALSVDGASVSCLNRTVEFAPHGLPASIRSGAVEILAEPAQLVVETDSGAEQWTAAGSRVVAAGSGLVERESENQSGTFEVRCSSKMEFDGYLDFRLRISAKSRARVRDIRLEMPIRTEAATYMMGMGRRGGLRPRKWDWKWDAGRANNAVWIGAVTAGLMCKLKGLEDTWDLHDLKSSGIPQNWSNGGQGGCSIQEEGDRVVLRAYTGARTLPAGEELVLRFGLLITPVKPLDPDHWRQRYYHRYAPPEEALAAGATIVNIHHGCDINPYINYPFLSTDRMKAYVSEAHGKGVKVKIYYTVRELSSRAVEIWALRSLGNEVLASGPGNGHSWLCEHLEADYSPAWHQTLANGEVDAAVATAGLSRWHNYYLEGLAWLLKHVGIDGLYLDGIGYDREVMKRVRRVLDQNRSGCLIDFHSGNSFDYEDLRISPAVAYMEHFPYVNSLWFGEMFDYGSDPDYWLVEISGIPFGLFGEMLERNGNPWRGMIYGMTARYYQGAEPKHIWKIWDEFGIGRARMLGYWDAGCPVKTDQTGVLATAYVRANRVLIALASWSREPVDCRLHTDFRLGRLSAPCIPGFQDAREFGRGDAIPVQPGRGWLLLADIAE
ncbi:MAG: glycoside hydrolase domain-containing protein [Bryobacteraceae bacterium]